MIADDKQDSLLLQWIEKRPDLITEPLKIAKLIHELGKYKKIHVHSLASRITELVHIVSMNGTDTKKHKILLTHESVVKKIDEEFGGNINKASRELNIPRATLLRWYKNPPKKGKSIQRFVVTYAQNNTSIHTGFYAALQTWMKEWKAELICYKGTYRNPTSQREAEWAQSDMWWDKRILPYLLDSNRDLNDNLQIFPARTIPTATYPLSGYDTATGSMSGIFPHPKVQLKTVATPGNLTPKILTTTGAITIPSYSKSKAGEASRQHHIIGAAIVEIQDNKTFHIRHIAAEESGNFYDIAGGTCKYYTAKGHSDSDIDILTRGDIHYPWIDEQAVATGMELISKLRPNKVYLHDLIDFWAVGHHEIKNRFLNAAKHSNGEICVKTEMKGAAEFLTTVANPDKYETIIVPSNHNEHLDQWLNTANIDNIGPNAEYFHWLSYMKHRSANRSFNGYTFDNTLETAIREFVHPELYNVRFLDRDESSIVNGVDYSHHGDLGPNGSRGSSMNISKIGIKTTIGHSHSPSIVNGCYQVGVSSVLPLAYARGPSSWMHTDCISYKNGKRTLVHYVDGKYCLSR